MKVKDWLWCWQQLGQLRGTPAHQTETLRKPLKKVIRLVDSPLRACIFLKQNAGPPELHRMWLEHRQERLTVVAPLRPKRALFHITVGDLREILGHGEALQIPAAPGRSCLSQH